jgi:hypothetical protein
MAGSAGPTVVGETSIREWPVRTKPDSARALILRPICSPVFSSAVFVVQRWLSFSGRGESGRARYGCPLKHARGICENGLHIRQDSLEREVLSEDVVRYTFAQFKQQLQERLEGTRSQLTVLRTERERRLDEISDGLLASDGHGIDARLREIEDFVLSRMKDLGALLAGETPRAKAEMTKHCTGITLTPEGKTYRLSGEWDLLGVRSDGAGGPACT